MPKYFLFKIMGYYLYFTSHCIMECMHAHASDEELSEEISAKFWVKADGDTVVAHKGTLKDREIRKIQKFIKEHYVEMYKKWSRRSRMGFYIGTENNTQKE